MTHRRTTQLVFPFKLQIIEAPVASYTIMLVQALKATGDRIFSKGYKYPS